MESGMTTFQLVCLVLFLLALAAAYRDTLLRFLKRAGAPVSKEHSPEVKPSIAVSLVNDILAVTELRDRLSAEGCKDGVEACTTLLRVIVEYDQPSKGVV
jgi:hypothetical protein